MVMVIYFGNVPFLLLLRSVKIVNFMISLGWIRGIGLDGLLWHGWLPMLSGINGASPWAASASESASYLVEAALGSYSSSVITEWGPPDGYDRVGVAPLVPDHPNNVWSDGSPCP